MSGHGDGMGMDDVKLFSLMPLEKVYERGKNREIVYVEFILFE